MWLVLMMLVVTGRNLQGADVVSQSQESTFRFARLSTDAGLSDVDVRAIAQDRLGFMWFGTSAGGLNRYDGQEFKHHRHDDTQPGSLSYDFVWNLYLDRQGALWVCTMGGGLDRYVTETDSFEHHKHDPKRSDSLPSNSVLCAFEDSAGGFWIGTRGGLSRMDRTSGRFTTYTRKAPNKGNLNTIRAIAEDRVTGLLWLATSEGLCAFDRRTGFFQSFRFPPSAAADAASNAVNDVMVDPDGSIWAITEIGLNRVHVTLTKIDEPDPPEIFPQFESHMHDPARSDSLSHSHVRHALIDREGRMWVTSADGLNLFDRKTGSAKVFRGIFGDPDSLSRSDSVEKGRTVWRG